MLSKRYYDTNELPANFFESIDLFFIGICKEERTHYIPSLLNGKFAGKIITVEYDIESEKYILHNENKIVTESTEDSEGWKDLMPCFFDDLRNLGINDKNILIESTSLSHTLLFYLMKIMRKDFKPKHFYITYAEPKKYEQTGLNMQDRRFDLTEKFCNRSSIPGFLRISNQDKSKTLITIMGFEGNRFSKTYEEVNPAPTKTYAIVGFPSYQPSWQYYVYAMNKEVLEQSKAYNNIYGVTAYDPFGIYDVLKKIVEIEQSNEIVIAPLGTKPHSIGTCLFAMENENVQLYYDYPFFGKKIRTTGVGKSYLYNLSVFINE